MIIIFGSHGSGKGTQAELISKHYDTPKITTGEIFRDMVKKPGNVGYIDPDLIKTVRQYLDNKQYVSDEITNEVVRHRLLQEDCKNGFILDGYPRTLKQAEFLAGLLSKIDHKLDVVINLVVSEDNLLARQLNRIVCENSDCGASFNTLLGPPEKEGVCDNCGFRLYRRPEDTEEGIRKRNMEYESKARPLIDYYRKFGFVVDVDGNKKAEEIFDEIRKVV